MLCYINAEQWKIDYETSKTSNFGSRAMEACTGIQFFLKCLEFHLYKFYLDSRSQYLKTARRRVLECITEIYAANYTHGWSFIAYT